MIQTKTAALDIRPPANRLRTASEQHLEAKPGKTAIELRVVAANGDEPAIALSDCEKGRLGECEGIIQGGLGTFFEVGDALLTIRDGRLYRDTHATFKLYCQERWNIGKAYTYRVIGAAERLKLLPSSGQLPKPANECQMRPFLKLSPEDFPGAWNKVVKTAKGKVTNKIVQAVIRELLPKDRRAKKRKRTKAKLPLGQILALLTEAKRQVEKGEKDGALAALERIEGLLFGP